MSHTSPRNFPAQFCLLTALVLLVGISRASGQTGQPPNRAIVVDDRLSVLRAAPGFSAPHLRRLSRGRRIVIFSSRLVDGSHFYRVAVTRRTRGWIQREALVVLARRGDDERLLRLINAVHGFDRIARARIFLDAFPRSALRPSVLLLFGEEAKQAAAKLSRDAGRRIDAEEVKASGASLSAYYLNFSGLDRYRKQGIVFSFDPATKQFHADEAAWRELLRRYPHSPEAAELRRKREQTAEGRRQEH